MGKIVQKIPFLRLSVALAAGIALGSITSIRYSDVLLLYVFLLAILVFINRRYSYRKVTFFGIGVGFLFLATGILVYKLYNKKPEFYTKGPFFATVLEKPVEKPNSWQSVLKIEAIHHENAVVKSREKLMVYFSKGEGASRLTPGETITFKHPPQFIANNNNPYEFDYQGYLARKKIYRQVYLPSGSWKKTHVQSTFHPIVTAEKIRLRLLGIYEQQEMDENHLSILSALTLGYKRGLDPETRSIFAAAGAMHVLAVSGLHVGIVFMVLSFSFGFLRRQQAGRPVFILLVLICLWLYALITGLSPSVSRAAAMFSFVVVGNNLKKQSNIYNTLAASAFFLLLFNPNMLFEVGFQLSYSAVFGIVFLQPRLEKLITVDQKIVRYFWVLLTVSVAAQIATFPFSVYYFNQFPVFFWLSNLIIIPAVMLFIPLGMLLLAFHWIPLVPAIISFVLDNSIGFVYGLLGFIEKLPLSVIEFSFLPVELFFVLGTLFSLFLFINFRRILFFKASLFFLLFLLTASLIFKTGNLFRKEMIVYNNPGNTIIQLIAGNQNYIVSEKELPRKSFENEMVKNTVKKVRLEPPVYITLDSTCNDDQLLLKNGVIIFDGRVIQTTIQKDVLPENILPDVIVGPVNPTWLEKLKRTPRRIISTSRLPREKISSDNQIFYLTERGAYRKKW